ncbi:MAG: hypothetical protein IT366_10715 [Candidatus Hydrogenedentes bacterium]|nr:hypothetical protein [Candidatus Hydrogenedentota bacterium]
MWGFVVLIGITILLYALGIYALVGVFAALSLHARGLRVLDHSTAGAPLLFRALITPGMIALWPVLVLKWRKAARGLEAAGAPDSPVRAMGLRRIHGLAVRGLAVALPVVIAVAVVVRQPIATSEAVAPLQEPAPLPHVATERKNAFDDLPIALRIRTDNLGSWQLELDVARDLEKAALGLYWSDVGDNALSLGHAVYLGNVYGPGARRFVLDAARLSAGGSLLLYSFVEADVVARADVAPISARASGG